MKKIKIKWKVSEAPSGMYRSFYKRGWPKAYYENGDICAQIICKDSYTPSNIKTKQHAPIYLWIANYNVADRNKDGRWTWEKVETAFSSLKEVKQAIEVLLKEYPEWTR